MMLQIRFHVEQMCDGFHLSFWPIVLLKNIIIHFSCPVCHKHYGLVAHTSMASLIELQ